MVDLDEYRDRSLDSWERFSGNWEDEREFLAERTGPVRERMVERLDPQPGETILELAAGTGETGFAVAERLGDDGRLIMTDFAPGMVEAARRRGEELGLSNVEYRVLDAERMDLDDDSVDGVSLPLRLHADGRSGEGARRDPARAARRRPAGVRRLGARRRKTSGRRFPGMTMVELGHMPPPEPGAPGIFAMGDPRADQRAGHRRRLRRAADRAGRRRLGIHDPDEHWEKTLKLAAPIADAYAITRAGSPGRGAREKVTERVAEQIQGGGLRGRVHVVLAS